MKKPFVHKEKTLDSTLSLLLSPYLFISRRLDEYGTDGFETRLMFRKTVCLRGEEAARLFYDTSKFTRNGAAPLRVRKTLFGQGGVQGMDGESHRRRKEMFMSILAPQNIPGLLSIFERNWLLALDKWQKVDSIVLLDELRLILTASICKWAGVSISEFEYSRFAEYLSALIDSAGAVGPRHWKGRLARDRTESQLAAIITDIRNKTVETDRNSAVFRLAMTDDPQLYPPRIAAVELLNILRPTVAVALFITFAALALHRHPEYRQKIGDGAFLEWFTQEVRRFYPFFPCVSAIVKKPFNRRGYTFSTGTRVLLDLYGTNHDRRCWQDPERFYPERFRNWDENPYSFIPQGGGDYLEHHRCAGEWLTIELIKRALRILTEKMSYKVPEQNLEVKLNRVPAQPQSGFVMKNIKKLSW